ncbi:MAG: hypothetical protein LBK13_05855 [Spirochaetales bacterium]|nr:hypothetical protein [Spirochaetales bacterium]
MPQNMTKAIQRYKKTGMGLGAILQYIHTSAYAFAEQNRYCREDDCPEFLLSFYHRIPGVLRRYKPSAADFEPYLRGCFIWHMKSYLAVRIQKNRKEKIIYEESCAEFAQQEEENWELHDQAPQPPAPPPASADESPDMDEAPAESPARFQPSLRLLLLALKCANDISDRLISLTAAQSGIHRAVVFHFVEIMRTIMGSRQRRIGRLIERRRRNYFRLQYFLELRRYCRDSFHAEELEKRIRRERKLCESVSRTLAATPKSPPHSDIAGILGIPKGTVDSGYFYMRRARKGKA